MCRKSDAVSHVMLQGSEPGRNKIILLGYGRPDVTDVAENKKATVHPKTMFLDGCFFLILVKGFIPLAQVYTLHLFY